MAYKPSIVERMNRGLNFQKRNSLLKKTSPFKDTDPHTAEGGHSHAGDSASAGTFSDVLPGGTRSTFQGSTTAKFDPSTVEKQEHVTGTNYLESTPESKAAYMALSPEKRAAQDKKALQLQAKENLKTQNINESIDIANEAKIKQEKQKFELEQENKAMSKQFTIGDATEAQEQQASMSAFETLNSELAAARTAALENAGDMFSKTYTNYLSRGKTPEYARNKAAEEANLALKRASYFNKDQFASKQVRMKDFFPGEQFEEGEQVRYIQGTPDQPGLGRFGTNLFDDTQLAEERYGGRYYSADPTDLYGITEKYFDAKGKTIDQEKYRKLKKRGKDPRLELTYGSELQKYLQQFEK
tara:strand:- start:2274 stop:3341 length:1068 start_codon:yes stop_codon:yes gene_type:complete